VHVWSAYSPQRTWESIAREYIEARDAENVGDHGPMQGFRNETLGETWEFSGSKADQHALRARAQDLELRVVAYGCVITLGVDVQKDRIEVSVYEFGPGEEAWAIDHLIVAGDTAGLDPWADLAAELDAIGPDCGAIDTGYNTDQVLAFAARRPWLFPCKGIEGRGKTLIESDDERKCSAKAARVVLVRR
jgi:phage terminase large subunit GpA-like protein